MAASVHVLVAVRVYKPSAHHALVAEENRALRQAQVTPETAGHYRMWETEVSPYSAKVRAYLRYKRIPYVSLRINWQAYFELIPSLIGQPMVPVLIAPDGGVMVDSTPMIGWLEDHHPERRIRTGRPALDYIATLLDDFADEYILRFSIHYRWNNELTREALGYRIARTLAWGNPQADTAALASFAAHRQTAFAEQLGITAQTRPDLERQLLDLLAVLNQHFEDFEFLLGGRPCLGDFALYGHFYAHLYNDPYPATILEKHGPRVCEWIERISRFGDERGHVSTEQDARGDLIDLNDGVPQTLLRLLEFVAATYVPMSAGCAVPSCRRIKSYTVPIRGFATTFGTHHYRAWSFEQVQLALLALGSDERRDIDPLLTAAGILPALLAEGVQHNGLYDGFTPPFPKDGVMDNRLKHLRDKSTGAAES